jgi:putative ABC transport system permease protein
VVRRTPIAWRNLTHRKVRALVALSGVCFSVLLVFMQIGFYSAVLSAASAVYHRMDSDIFLTSPAYVFLGRMGSVPRERLFQARGVNGVVQAAPFYADTQLWRNPETRLRYQMLIMGFEPSLDLLGVSGNSDSRLENGRILIDSLTRPHFGPQATGTVTELGDRQVQIAGQYQIGPGFATDGAAIMDDDTFIRITKGSIEKPGLIAVRTSPGADIQEVAAALRKALPEDTRVFTREEMIQREEDYWAIQTSIGPVFAAGAVLGLIIGIVILYQVMVTDIANHIREYATLKALGYGPRRLQAIVLQEVSAFSAAGFLVGWLLSAILYKVVRDETGLPMSMPPGRTLMIFVLTLLMCWTAGLLSTRKLHKANPAELF